MRRSFSSLRPSVSALGCIQVLALALALALALMLGFATPAAAEEAYQQIRVFLAPPDRTLQQLLSDPDIQLMDRGDERQVEVLSRPSITDALLRNGWKLEVIHHDLESYYRSRQGRDGDYGVWHTYQETIDELTLLHSQYPNLTTEPISLGTTSEGRNVWAIKVSDNPGIEEDDEPDVLYDGVHHAREIMTVEVCLYFARYLCENYGTDPLCTFLVDNRQVWFVPIVNPDGFVYNELTNPDGGGMWRKNRRVNGGGCYGVDNNRNYPFFWGGQGSDGDPCSDGYRGPSPGSEPENQAIMNLVNSHHFATHNSWHSVVGMQLLPWGYTLAHTPDDPWLRRIGAEMSRDNGYLVGQPGEILYIVSGGSIDWMYGDESEHARIFSFSTEIGGSGFWPLESEREGLLQENLYSILYTTAIAGGFVTVADLTVSGGDGHLDPGDTIDLVAAVRNDGRDDVPGVTLRLTCDDPYIALLHADDAIGTLPGGGSWDNAADPFRIEVEPDCPAGRVVTFVVVADAPGGIHVEVPFTFEIGELPVVYSNDFEAGSDWSRDVTDNALTGAFDRIDPVGTTFQPEDDATPGDGVYALVTAQNPNGLESVQDVDVGIAAIRSPDFDLSGCPDVRLSMNYFHGQRDAGDDPGGGDFFRIDVSPNAGGTWVNLLHLGDVASAAIWQNLVVNLAQLIPITNQVRFRIQVSDRMTAVDTIEGGIDDFTLYSVGSANQQPGPPTPLDPPDGGMVVSTVTLTVGNAEDPEGDPLTYGFRVYADAAFTDLVASVDEVASGEGATSWQVDPPLPSGTYYWRAFAKDAEVRGMYSPAFRFDFRATSGASDPAREAAAGILVTPNPASAGTRIRYMIPATLTSRLSIHDPQGRVVRELRTVPSATGWHEVVWDGRDDAGRRVPSGAYWVRLWTPGATRTVRVVRID
ncbi:MAG: M14 family zinc carboxypeptidase [Candidatus Eisenbacteria bacterium]|nr:M14 family zinc carboxypeptidase [Candidatus Eisenbacteria bacterium]